MHKYCFIHILLVSLSINTVSDSFEFNTYNNHGVVGLINMPTARFFNESVHGITVYDGTPDQKITLSSNPFNWLEASFFYSNNQSQRYCEELYDPVCRQDHKDKGFNIKLRLKEQGKLPALALGIYDLAGTGYYSSEYLVGSYGINRFDFHFGLGWGALNGSTNNFKNPLINFDERFSVREKNANQGGQFSPSVYFSGKNLSPFFGISYSLNNKILLKIENDTTLTPGSVGYEKSKSNFSFGFNYKISENFSVGLSQERNNYFSLKFVYKNDAKASVKKYKYEVSEHSSEDSKYKKLIKNLEKNGIGVNKISETASSIGLELTQFVHPNIAIVEEIISSSARDAGIKKNIKKDIKIVDMTIISDINDEFVNNSKLIYERKKSSNFSTNTGIKFRPFLASREEFFKGAVLLENDSELILRDNLIFITNIKYSLANNFNDLIYPPKNTFPAQVRSDIKQYLKNMDKGLLLGRAQLDFYKNITKDHYVMLSAGILEDMFNGYGFEYLYFKENSNYAIGFEAFNVKKRDYDWKFGSLDYQNITGSINLYYRNHGLIPFDMQLSYGEYLAGDVGATFDVSRSFQNGTKFGIFASKTNVSAEQFGEGSFDKGIYFNIPIYGNFINYTWKPLTKDPGARLARRNSLHQLLIRFRPIN